MAGLFLLSLLGYAASKEFQMTLASWNSCLVLSPYLKSGLDIVNCFYLIDLHGKIAW